MTGYDFEVLFEMMGVRLKRGSGGNRNGECPLSKWTHTKGTDKKPSLTAIEGEPGAFRCWACHHEGSIIKLAELYSGFSGDHRPHDFVKNLTKKHLWGRKHEYGANLKRVGQKVTEKIKTEITPERLSGFMQRVPNYALQRGITKEQILRWEIGFDPKEDRMIFTLRDRIRTLVGVSGRDITGFGHPKYKHYAGSKKETMLYGEPFIDRSVKRAIIVEGFMDVLALERFGFKNTLATMGTSLSSIQMGKLERWFKEVVFIPDVDDKGAGLQFVETYGERMTIKGMKVGVAGVTLNPKFVPRQRPVNWEESDHRFTPSELLRDKDPADLTKEELDLVLNEICWIELRASSTVDPIFL